MQSKICFVATFLWSKLFSVTFAVNAKIACVKSEKVNISGLNLQKTKKKSSNRSVAHVLKRLELVDRVRCNHINVPELLVLIQLPLKYPLIIRNIHILANTFYRHVKRYFYAMQCVSFPLIVANI